MKTKRAIRKKQKKEHLRHAYEEHRQALERELHIAADRVLTFAKNLAVVGGVLYVGYTVLDRYLDAKLKSLNNASEAKQEDKYATLKKIILPFVALALQQGSMIMLRKARLMLINYLEEKDTADD
ncbi:MAG TPA: hypothetical protein ENJ39_07180 [Flammeovirgaceae bacterium]|nr:hypothetical protein [Flammeovirgaceae bacterium]